MSNSEPALIKDPHQIEANLAAFARNLITYLRLLCSEIDAWNIELQKDLSPQKRAYVLGQRDNLKRTLLSLLGVLEASEVIPATGDNVRALEELGKVLSSLGFGDPKAVELSADLTHFD